MIRSKEYRDSYVAAHISNTIAAQIYTLRIDQGWTQGALATEAGMKQSRISALEDPNYENYEVKTLRRIASALNVALTVRFVPFSELVHWAENISDDRLKVKTFAKMRCLFCKKDATFRLSGLFPEVGEFGTCDAHLKRGENRLRLCTDRWIACLKVIRQEDLERALVAAVAVNE